MVSRQFNLIFPPASQLPQRALKSCNATLCGTIPAFFENSYNISVNIQPRVFSKYLRTARKSFRKNASEVSTFFCPPNTTCFSCPASKIVKPPRICENFGFPCACNFFSIQERLFSTNEAIAASEIPVGALTSTFPSETVITNVRRLDR